MKFAIFLCFVLVAVVVADETEESAEDSDPCPQELKTAMKESRQKCPPSTLPPGMTMEEVKNMSEDDKFKTFEGDILCNYDFLSKNKKFMEYSVGCGINNEKDITPENVNKLYIKLAKACKFPHHGAA